MFSNLPAYENERYCACQELKWRQSRVAWFESLTEYPSSASIETDREQLVPHFHLTAMP